MKQLDLSPRIVELLVGILATLMIAVGLFLYALNEPDRIVSAQAEQTAQDLDIAMTLYAENCSVCHGVAGEGIGATLPLNNPALRTADPASLTKIIARGLFNTAMPAWSQLDGGSLSEYQIAQMVLLIQQGDWGETKERVVSLGLEPRLPFTAEADPAILETLKTLQNGEQLSRGVALYAENCVACHGADGLGSALAPALNDPAVRQKTPAELLRTLQTGVSGTLMAGWDRKLSEEDLNDLLALITGWEDVPTGAIPAPDQPVMVTAESLALGGDLYSANCARCHGPEGQGTQRAPALNVKSVLTSTNDAALQQIISLGVPGTAMPAWGDRLVDTEIQALVGFIRSWEPNAPEVATPLRGPWWRSQNSGQTSSQGNSQLLPSGGVQSGKSKQTTNGQAGASITTSDWLQGLDWRAFALVAAGLWVAFTLIGLAISGLRKTL
jgi:mono/diheme cytochrome c family protein